MKLKLYFMGVLASALCLQTVGQSTQKSSEEMGPSYRLTEPSTVNIKRDYSTAGAKNTFYTNEFDDADQWILTSEGEQGEWEITDNENSDLAASVVGEMASASAANGYAQFNGLFFLNNPPVLVQNATIELDETINCLDEATVAVTFNQRMIMFNYDRHFLEVSADNGVSWSQFEVNDEYSVNTPFPSFQGERTVDVSEVAAGEEFVRIRFRWLSDPLSEDPTITPDEINSFGAGYGWMIDDLNIASLPVNELIAGETFYDDQFETFWTNADGTFAASEETTDLDQVSSFEYHTQPDYSTKPFNFACIVTNGGSDEQTGVALEVTMTAPDGTVEVFTNDGITVAPGVTDTLRNYGVEPLMWNDPVAGAHTLVFRIVQNEVDEFPGNNTGVVLTTRISSDAEDGTAFIQHDNFLTQGVVDGQDITAGTRYTFAEDESTNRVITSVRFALNETSIDGVGEQIFLNVRSGSVLEEESEENPITLYFSYDEDDEDAVTYEVLEEDLSLTSAPVWIEATLPSPVLIQPNLIYQAEMTIPLLGGELVFIGATSTRQSSSSVIFDPDDQSTGPFGYFFFGGSVYNLAFGTENILSVSDVSYESGIKLVQNFPNPVVNNTTIQYQLDETSEVTFEVFDITGKLVHSEDFGNVPALTNQLIDFNRAGLASGTYTYGIVTETERLTRKMIIQ
jgi:hypothetical protein